MRRPLALALAASLATAGCVVTDGQTGSSSSSSSSSSGGSSSGGTATSGSSEVDALFGTLPTATSGKLQGVWSQTTSADSGTADVRFRFADGKLVAGVKCTYPAQGNAALMAGATTTLATTDLASASGTFRIGQELAFQKTSGQLDCEGKLANLSYQFQISGTTMQLGAEEASGTASLTKVGD